MNPALRSEQKPLSLLQVWWLAIRPRTLPASMAGVAAGVACAVLAGQVRAVQSLVALAIALLLQIGSNLANDVFDHERGADAARAFGPTRVTESGLLRPAQVKTGMIVVFALAALLGLFLATTVGWVVVPVGALAILCAIAYTGGPYPLGYHGLGELFVLLFFGFASVGGTAYVNLSWVPPSAWALSLPLGLLIVGILVVNNLRDIDADRLADKRTLAVRFGERFSKAEYTTCLAVSFLALPIFCAAGILHWWAMLAWLTLPLAWRNVHQIHSVKGTPLNAVLAGTGQLALFYGLAVLVGSLISTLL